MTGLITGVCSMCGEKAVFNEVEFQGEVLDISLCCNSEILTLTKKEKCHE